jgi:hypothetical protein
LLLTGREGGLWMTTLVHKTVGEKRIKEICDEFGLTAEDAKIIDQILEKWKLLLGKDDQKVKVAFQLIGDNPNGGNILKALLQINAEFLFERMYPDPNC